MKKHCYLCRQNVAPEQIDFRNLGLLKKFVTPQAKIAPRRRTGVCAKHQRLLARQIKRARHMALLPFTTRVIDTRERNPLTNGLS